MSGSRSLNNSTSKIILNVLEPVKLPVWEVMIERVTIVKFRVNYEVAMVLAVLKSKYGRIQRSSRMFTLQNLIMHPPVG